jgi:hypothetical protein
MSKRRKTSKQSPSPIDAIDVPDAISSLYGKKRTPKAEAEAATNTSTALTDALPTPNVTSIAEAATSAASVPPDVVARPSLLLI